MAARAAAVRSAARAGAPGAPRRASRACAASSCCSRASHACAARRWTWRGCASPRAASQCSTGGPWFSVSHCASRVAVALSDACEVGLDLEDAAAPPGGAARARCERWTATEAALKAVGAGMRSRARCAPGRRPVRRPRLDDAGIRPACAWRLAADCVAYAATPVAGGEVAVVAACAGMRSGGGAHVDRVPRSLSTVRSVPRPLAALRAPRAAIAAAARPSRPAARPSDRHRRRAACCTGSP